MAWRCRRLSWSSRRHVVFHPQVLLLVPPLVLDIVVEMLGRLAGRPLSRPQSLAHRAFKPQHYGQHAFNARVRDVLVAQRAWSSSPSLKQEHKPSSAASSEYTSSARQKPPFHTRVKNVVKWTAFFGASSVVGVLLIGGAIFLHDAFTYTERHIDRVPVNPLALHPETGGPKDLPIAAVLVGDEEDEENKKLTTKPRLVIVGGGWGVRSFIAFPLILCHSRSTMTAGYRHSFLASTRTIPCYIDFSGEFHNLHSPAPM